jgi:4-amino-4-deoxy-L-arabinose transferase-like glycosyltransferase
MRKLHVHLFFSLFTLALLLPGLNLVALFDWDELNFAEAAREMNLSRNYLYVQMGFEPFWEKPPLFIWLQAACENLFQSQQAWVYKIPNIAAGIFAVNWVYHVGDRLGKRMLGAFWALATLMSFTPYLYWRSGLIDPIFNLFIVMSLYQWYKITQAHLKDERSHIYYLNSGLLLGLALLTKGPVALGIMGLVVFWVTARRGKWHEIFTWKILLFFLGLTVVLGFWILPLLQSNGAQFIQEFIYYQITLFKGQIEWHNQPWYYHFVVLFFFAFPSSIFALPHLVKNQILDRNVDIWNLFMRALFWVVLIVFSIVSTKIVHYSSLCWWSLSYFGAYQVYLMHTHRWHFPRWLIIPLTLAATGIGLALWFLPIIGQTHSLPGWLMERMNEYARGVLASHETWTWTSLLPAALFSFWFLTWWVYHLLGKRPHGGILYLISGWVAMSTYFWILPQVNHALQGNLVKTIQQETRSGVFLETWHFKTYTLYFHGKFTQKDFQNLKPEFENPLEEPYPQQSSRRSHAMNRNNLEKIKVITKVNYTPDYAFLEKFKIEKKLGGYILWRKVN